MIYQRKTPVASGYANGVLDIKALAGVDVQNPTEIPHEIQSEMLAVASVMRRFHVSRWHAQTICRLSGLGGQHA